MASSTTSGRYPLCWFCAAQWAPAMGYEDLGHRRGTPRRPFFVFPFTAVTAGHRVESLSTQVLCISPSHLPSGSSQFLSLSTVFASRLRMSPRDGVWVASIPSSDAEETLEMCLVEEWGHPLHLWDALLDLSTPSVKATVF